MKSFRTVGISSSEANVMDLFLENYARNGCVQHLINTYTVCGVLALHYEFLSESDFTRD